MKARIFVLPLLLAACCVAGFTQKPAPSITIGTHVLTLGMPESAVLDQLGSDLELHHLGTGKVSSWMVERKVGSVYEVVGNVVFDGHVLTNAIRHWEIEESSSNSLFYAINEAITSVQGQGHLPTACQISAYGTCSTMDAPDGRGSGSIDMMEILIDCGVKQIKITRYLSDTPGVSPSAIKVTEWLQGK